MEKQSPSRTPLVCLLVCLAIALLALIFPFIVDGAAESPYAGLVALAISWWVVAPLALIGAAISGIIMLVRHWRKRPPNPRVVVFGVVAIGIVALVLVFVIPAARQPGLVEEPVLPAGKTGALGQRGARRACSTTCSPRTGCLGASDELIGL